MTSRRAKKPTGKRGRGKSRILQGHDLKTDFTKDMALQPFADVEIPSGKDGECVWFYVGKPLADDHGHLELEDFRRARRAVG